VALDGRSADRLLTAIRRGTPPVVARIESAAVILDMRTVEPSRDVDLARAVEAALAAVK
jgi:hypothetical protein